MMKEIVFPFTKYGWIHELVRREGPVVLVGRHKKGGSKHYEVIILRIRPAAVFTRSGNSIQVPAQEVYPRSEHWGKYGFTYSPAQCGSAEQALKKAQKKFEELLAPG